MCIACTGRVWVKEMKKGGAGHEKEVMMPRKILFLWTTGCQIPRFTQIKGNNQVLEYTSIMLCLPAAGSPWREMDPPYKEPSVGGESDVPSDKPPDCWWNKPPCFTKPCTQATQVPLLSQKGWKSVFVLNCVPFFLFLFFLFSISVCFVCPFWGGEFCLVERWNLTCCNKQPVG